MSAFLALGSVLVLSGPKSGQYYRPAKDEQFLIATLRSRQRHHQRPGCEPHPDRFYHDCVKIPGVSGVFSVGPTSVMLWEGAMPALKRLFHKECLGDAYTLHVVTRSHSGK